VHPHGRGILPGQTMSERFFEMKKPLHAALLAATFGLCTLPMIASAQTATDPKMLTCSEFNSMSDADKMTAVVEMQKVSDDASANATAPVDVALDGTKKACLANPKIDAIDAMAMK
jgi:hypothetical protein